jgi:hypothetical protein
MYEGAYDGDRLTPQAFCCLFAPISLRGLLIEKTFQEDPPGVECKAVAQTVLK